MSLPTDAKQRKAVPLCTGVLDYFPDALAAVAECSKIGNDQHNAGQPLHWAKEKSTDEPDALLRHLIDRGTRDSDGVRHSAKVAWRALALLQREIDAERTIKVKPPTDWESMEKRAQAPRLPTTLAVSPEEPLSSELRGGLDGILGSECYHCGILISAGTFEELIDNFAGHGEGKCNPEKPEKPIDYWGLRNETLE